MEPTLADVLDAAWTLLVRGAGDRKSPVHTPVVASVGADGAPQARVMVLRKADRAAGLLRFHTDVRSAKVASLDGGRVAVLAYHPGQAVQLRVSGIAEVVAQGAEVDAIWAASTPFARRCYMVDAGPGTVLAGPGSGLPVAVEGCKPDEDELVPARANFAIVRVRVTGIDWLHLAQTGHRRAVFAAADGWRGGWVVP
jgi:pyridoxamine 5'-phosphate oxidase